MKKKYENKTVVFEINNDVYYNNNLNYYDSNNLKNENLNDEKLKTYFVALILTFVFVCRRCNERFIFNKQLHNYLRINCFRLKKFFTNQFLSKTLIYFIKVFFIDVIKTFNANNRLLIFRFNVDAFKNVEIDYDFRDWNYVKTKIILIENNEKKNIVIDIDVDITLKNENFIRRQKSNVVVRKIFFFIIVRDFDTTQHENSRYVILFIYFIDTKNNVFVKIFIEQKIYLIKNLKINMLINNNIIVLKNIFVNFTNQITNIRNCNVDVSLKIRFKVAHIQQRFVHVKKIIVLSSRIQLIVVVHNFFDNLSFDRDFFFESNDIEFTFYVYFVDFFTKIILITNNID